MSENCRFLFLCGVWIWCNANWVTFSISTKKLLQQKKQRQHHFKGGCSVCHQSAFYHEKFFFAHARKKSELFSYSIAMATHMEMIITSSFGTTDTTGLQVSGEVSSITALPYKCYYQYSYYVLIYVSGKNPFFYYFFKHIKCERPKMCPNRNM